MKVSWTEGVGVTASGPTSDSTSSANIAVNTGVVLLDASYDGSNLTGKKPFWTTANRSDSDGKSSSYMKVDQKYKEDNNSNYYYGLSWKLTFTVDVSKSGNSNYDIFFDVNGDSTKKSGSYASDSANNLTASAFRVSMGTGDNRIIWAPNSSSTTVNDTGYVSDEKEPTKYTSASTSNHGSICNDTKDVTNELAVKANDKGSDNTKRGDYLGTTSASSSDNTSATLDVNVVVWFEGNDTNMITSNLANGVGSIITANMKFYARE